MKPRFSLLYTATLCITLSACASVKKQDLMLSQQNELASKVDLLTQLSTDQQQTIQTLDEDLKTLAYDLITLNDGIKTLKQKISASASAPKPVAPPATAPVKKTKPKVKPELAALKPEKVILGRVEWAMLGVYKEYLKARVDTGAKSSSLHATNIQFFERDGEKWVKFNIFSHEKTKTNSNKSPTLESPLTRTVKIKQASTDEAEERAVIRLMIEVGELKDELEFTLTNRDGMNYPILLGRNFLRDVAVVDVAKSFTQKRKLAESKVDTKTK